MIKVNEIYKNLPRLETTHFILRKVTVDDLEDMFAYSSDEEVTRFLRWGPHRTQEETECTMREVLREYEEGKDGPWGIEYRQTGRVVGSIHLMAISAQHSKAEIGFVLSRSYRDFGVYSMLKRDYEGRHRRGVEFLGPGEEWLESSVPKARLT